jgi:ABC-2 type transport system permease protein
MRSIRSASRAIFVRDLLLAFSYRFHLFVRYSVSLLGVFFLYYLSRFVQSGPLTGTADYFSYTLVGFVLSQYFSLVLVSLSRSMRDDQLMGTVEPLMGGPTPPAGIALGASVFPLAEGALLAATQLAAGVVVLGADFTVANWWGVALAVLLSLICLESLAFLSAAFVMLFKKGDPITPLIAASSFVFTGVFFPFEQLPWVFRWLSYCIPMTYALRAVRTYVFTGVPLGDAVALHDVRMLLLFGAVMAPLSIWFFKHAEALARRKGTLCHY